MSNTKVLLLTPIHQLTNHPMPLLTNRLLPLLTNLHPNLFTNLPPNLSTTLLLQFTTLPQLTTNLPTMVTLTTLLLLCTLPKNTLMFTSLKLLLQKKKLSISELKWSLPLKKQEVLLLSKRSLPRKNLLKLSVRSLKNLLK